MTRSMARALRVRGLLAAGAAAILLVGLPAPAFATAPTSATSAATGASIWDPIWKTTDADKIRALTAIKVLPAPELVRLGDRDFIFEVWRRTKDMPEVRGAAELALMEKDPAGYVAFIKGGIHDAITRQIANDLVAAEAARTARELRKSAASHAKVTVSDEELLYSEYDFVALILVRAAEDSRVKKAAENALRDGNAELLHQFLATGVREAAAQDVQDLLDKIAKEEAEKLARLEDEAARRAAAVELGIEVTDGMMAMKHDDFIRVLWDHSEDGSEVQAAAIAALHSTDPAVWKQFIHTGIFEAHARDLVKAEAAVAARELRRSAAAHAKVVVNADELLYSERDFVALILVRAAEDSRVKKAAESALREGSAELLHQFLATGVREAAAQDIQDLLDKIAKEEEEKRARLEDEAARRAAASRLGIVTTEGMLVMRHDDFIRVLWDNAKEGSEVEAGAVKALRSKDPAVWKQFIYTGIHEARDHDLQIDLENRQAAERRRLEEIKTIAEREGYKNLAIAARKALAGTPDEIADFLRLGQYQIPPDSSDIAAFYDHGNRQMTLWRFDGAGEVVAAESMIWDSGPNAWTMAMAKPVAGDFNGDGKRDVAAFYRYSDKSSKIWFFESIDDAPEPKLAWNSGANQWDGTLSSAPMAGDFDGDGKDEIAALYDHGNRQVKLWLFDGIGSGTVTRRAVWDSGPNAWTLGNAKPVAGDFNGDGKTDVAAFYRYADKRSKIWLFESIDKTPKPKLAWDSGIGQWDGALGGVPVAGDFDGNGKDEIAAIYDHGNRQVKLWIFDGISTSLGLATRRVGWDSGQNAWTWGNITPPVVGDFNGDGRTDLAVFYHYANAEAKLWVFMANKDGVSPPRVVWHAEPGTWDTNLMLTIN